MRFLLIFLFIALLVSACGGNDNADTADEAPPESMVADESAAADDGKGVGEVKNVELNDPLNPELVEEGKAIYELKCAACHKLTDQRLVGPGWAGVTERRQPEWIMNMIMNADIMLAEDPVAQKLLEECLVRMPNQNLSREDARAVLEFMYSNDGHEVAAN
jgi:cytochrome c5